MTQTPEVRRNDDTQRYELLRGEQVLGYAEFRPAGEGAVMLPHTVIEEGHEGEGLGSQLARFALDDVRAQGKRVVPMCPFIAGYIRKHPEYTDLVHPQQRGVFGL
ncbi:N-acetyltransferase [Deinococcus sp. HMF7620]|uniref:N-acetyltransferase n=1 Tax=Deinococcus arboris TaxID=2682977 RepID=A0A7C9M7N7_9DEIO|nr:MULTISPECIES: GNAT family N-acetyltransferase [Deinococcus]MBZ9750259.1 N-acetyltransferase [Deinococcus betulae]MVN86403.1 N-acetyltransferase [Deinococcus arboris]